MPEKASRPNGTAKKVAAFAAAGLIAGVPVAGWVMFSKILAVTSLTAAPAAVILVALTIASLAIAYLIYKKYIKTQTITIPLPYVPLYSSEEIITKFYNQFASEISRQLKMTIDGESAHPTSDEMEGKNAQEKREICDQFIAKLQEKGVEGEDLITILANAQANLLDLVNDQVKAVLLNMLETKGITLDPLPPLFPHDVLKKEQAPTFNITTTEEEGLTVQTTVKGLAYKPGGLEYAESTLRIMVDVHLKLDVKAKSVTLTITPLEIIR